MIKTGKEGAGTYGIVYRAKMNKTDKTEIAVKRNIIDPDITFSGSLREMDLLNRLRGHPFIVKLLSVSFGNPFCTPSSPIMDRKGSYQEDYLHFVFEKADQNLHDIIYDQSIPMGYLKLSMVQIILAIEYMHSKGVIHRDIKPANLLWFVDEKNKTSVKLCDFGLSKIYTKQEVSSPGVVTCWYRAPEICSKNPEYSFSSDIWSVGCVFYEMVSKKALLMGYKDDDVKLLSKIIGISPKVNKNDIARLTKNKIKLNKEASPKEKKSWRTMIGLTKAEIAEFNEYPGGDSHYDNFLDLLDKMMRLNPDERLTAEQILAHPFFSSYADLIDWSRTHFPPAAKTEAKATIIDCLERKWAVQCAFNFYNERENLDWYKHRILFQSIDLFDRYLVYCDQNEKLLIPSKNNGKYMTKDKSLLRYLLCLYMCVKYFNVLNPPMCFKELLGDLIKVDKKILFEGEQFEQKMLRDVLHFRIYRETIFEAADRVELNANSQSLHLNEFQIRDIIERYGRLESCEDINVSDLLKKVLS